MALQVWLPFNGNITTNYGLTHISSNDIYANWDAPSYPMPAFVNGILGGSSVDIGLNSNDPLDGNDPCIHVNYPEAITTPFSFTMWVKEFSNSNSEGACLFALHNNNAVVFKCVKSATGYEIPELASGTLFTLNSGWNHVAIIATGTKIKAYVNGVLSEAGEVNQIGNINIAKGSAKITIGGYYSSKIISNFNGCVSNFKFYDNPISQFEVVNEANALVLHYSFNGNVSFGTGISNEDYPEGTDAEFYGFSGNKEYDLSGNEFDGTFGTKKPVTASDTPMYSSSYNFTSADPITVTINSTEFRTRYTVSIWAKGTGNAVRFSNGTALPVSDADAWHNIVVTSDGKKYMDGVESESIVSGLIGNGSCTVTIGGEAYSGKLSDFRIYAKKMSAEEIVALYKRKAAIDNTGKLVAAEVVVEDNAAPSFSKTGVVTAAAMNNWTGESSDPVDVTTFSILQTTGSINASDIIEI